MSLGGLSGPPAKDLLILIGVLFVTFSIQAFEPGSLRLLRLTDDAWRSGFLWQLVTYPYMGIGGPSIFFLLHLLILYWFGNTVRWALGQRRFWTLLTMSTGIASLCAVAVQIVTSLVTSGDVFASYALMQGQYVVMAVMIAAFATLRAEATILLFFVLPIKAKWFIWIEILFAWIGFLGNRDFAGFVGICVAVGATVALLRPGRLRGLTREMRLRAERWWIQQKMRGMRRRRKFKVVRGEGEDRGDSKREPWVH